MSLLIHGPSPQIDTLQKYIYAYSQLISKFVVFLVLFIFVELTFLISDGKLSNDITLENPHKFSIENKYYTADLLLHVLDSLHTTNEHAVEAFEGIILTPNEEHNNLNNSHYRLAHEAAEKDLRLRLLVVVNDKEGDIDSAETESNILWAIDHGYEYIEIFTNKLLESHNDRDKIGLPRLIEAMESTMWSTVQRKPKSIATTAQTTLPVPEEDSTTTTSTSTTSSYVPPLPVGISTDENPFVPPRPDDDEDDDDDVHVFSQLAQAMEQARIVRDRARNENLSDTERREQATQMMMKFAELLGLDESDGEEK